MRLPTGELLGSELSEFGARDAHALRIDLQHLADHRADHRLVALPRRGGVHRRGDAAGEIDADAAGIHPGGGLVLRIEQRLERRVAAARLQARGDADAGELALAAQPVALGDQFVVRRLGQHLGDHGFVVAAVVGRAARDEIGKLLVADHVAAAQLQPVDAELVRHLVDGALDGVIGRRLAERAHRLLHRLVGDDRDRLVLHALDLVRPDDGADRLAELERRAPGVGADVVERAHLHRADHAVVVVRDLDVEQPLRPVHVAAAHVLQPVLDQPHRTAEPLREIADQHGVLDAALDAVAAADVDVVVHAHGRGRQLQRPWRAGRETSASGSRPRRRAPRATAPSLP